MLYFTMVIMFALKVHLSSSSVLIEGGEGGEEEGSGSTGPGCAAMTVRHAQKQIQFELFSSFPRAS